MHRIDIEAVKREVLAAGFLLDGESDVLTNAAGPLTANVFDGSIRDRTSQFVQIPETRLTVSSPFASADGEETVAARWRVPLQPANPPAHRIRETTP